MIKFANGFWNWAKGGDWDSADVEQYYQEIFGKMKNKLTIKKESEVNLPQNFCDYVNTSVKAQILQSDDGQWYCILIAKNGQDLFTSETYKRKASIKKMLKNNFPNIKIV